MQTDSTYTKDQLKAMSDDELLSLLKNSWGISENEPISVIGKIYATYNTNIDQYHYRIHKIKKHDGFFLEYPISDLEQRDSISKNGIYTPSSFGASKKIKEYINDGGESKTDCELVLASLTEREKQDNPLLLAVAPNTIKILDEIEAPDIIKDENGNILVENSVVNYYTELNKQKIRDTVAFLDEEFEAKKNEVTLQIEELAKKYSLEEEKLQEQIHKQEKSLKRLEENRLLLVTDIKEKQQERNQLVDLIDELKIELERIEETMAKKLEKFRSFIKEKAEQLKNLEFIDEEEYNDLMMIKKDDQEENGEPIKSISFKDDLGLDYQKAISHIHSYLFNQDIIYPKYIIEDFMALIQTNDLIILAGESGSGKTNLVKSFAKAIGGKSIIVPVKPNWTSAEDLLGYYNPLEKKYLATPFLEALIEAQNNPTIPYFICLDEMNLARVEYYFADFLSLLEERDLSVDPEIQLYSDSESSHVLSEFKNVLHLIEQVKAKYQKNNILDFCSMLQDEDINNELKRVFGFSDKDSLIKYHTDLRKMISGLINTPSSIKFPKNVRVIGAINIDETTHYLSPKILDRAHIMKFDSPLLYDWVAVANEIDENDKKDHILKFDLIKLGVRQAYPSFNKDDAFCSTIVNFTKNYFNPMGVEVGLRTIRQGLNYQKIFIEQGSKQSFVMNNFILHKILPKLTFDGTKEITIQNVKTKEELLSRFKNELQNYFDENSFELGNNNVIFELQHIIDNAKNNHGIVNYWA